MFIFAVVQMPYWTRFDVDKVARATNGRPMAAVSKAAIKKLGLMKLIDPLRLDSFLFDLEGEYNDNKYHDSTHAADVVHAVFVAIEEVRDCPTVRCTSATHCCKKRSSSGTQLPRLTTCSQDCMQQHTGQQRVLLLEMLL